MARISVLGSGVVGSTYGALLANAGHDVTMLARGRRLRELGEAGLQVDLDGVRPAPACRVVSSLDADARASSSGSPSAEVLLVAVRADHLESVIEQVAAHPAALVLVFTNPLGLRQRVEQAVGRDRLVWCFSGVGGGLRGGVVTAHRVREQATVVEQGKSASPAATELLTPVDPRLHREPDMMAWLDTHTVFVAAMAAVVLELPIGTASERGAAARRLVIAMREGFDALEARGTGIRPRKLRSIFGWVPTPIATGYWARQLGQPMVTVSIAPHAHVTRTTEQRAVCGYALDLVGSDADRYRALVVPLT